MDTPNSTSIPRSRHLYASSRYQNASRRARKRSGGVSQACGMAPAESAHHWAWPPDDVPDCRSVQHTDLTGLCLDCHRLIEDFRRARASNIAGDRIVRLFGRLVTLLVRGAPDHAS